MEAATASLKKKTTELAEAEATVAGLTRRVAEYEDVVFAQADGADGAQNMQKAAQQEALRANKELTKEVAQLKAAKEEAAAEAAVHQRQLEAAKLKASADGSHMQQLEGDLQEAQQRVGALEEDVKRLKSQLKASATSTSKISHSAASAVSSSADASEDLRQCKLELVRLMGRENELVSKLR